MTTAPERVFYFGCVRESGHFWWKPGGFDYRGQRCVPTFLSGEEREIVPREGEVDGWLTPNPGCDDQPEGKALLHVQERFTMLAFWDRSVDKRFGSNSVFAVEGKHDFATAVQKAKEAFPEVWSRFTFEVVAAT